MLVTRYLSSVETYTKDLSNVVVAKTEIPLGAKITAEQLSLAPIPNGSVPQGAYRKLEQAIGRVAITPIGVRETITNLQACSRRDRGRVAGCDPGRLPGHDRQG